MNTSQSTPTHLYPHMNTPLTDLSHSIARLEMVAPVLKAEDHETWLVVEKEVERLRDVLARLNAESTATPDLLNVAKTLIDGWPSDGASISVHAALFRKARAAITKAERRATPR